MSGQEFSSIYFHEDGRCDLSMKLSKMMMDPEERDFVEMLVRYCRGMRASTSKATVAQIAAMYESYFSKAADLGRSPRAELELEESDAK